MVQNKVLDSYTFLQSRLFGLFLAGASVILIFVWSAASVTSPPVKVATKTSTTPLLSVTYYAQPLTSTADTHPVQPDLAPVVVNQASQPPLETYGGPFEPLPIASDQSLPPVLTKIPTSEPVVFLGIDDGWVQNSQTLFWLTRHHLPFTLFLTENGIKNNYDYFQQLQNAGMTVEDHTVTHSDLTKLTPDQQKAEICGAADNYESVFGARPTLFRPPYGKANQQTLQAAQACGMKAIIMWHALVQNGAFQFQDGLKHLEPGDIILMHFTNNFLPDIQTFINQVNADHLQVGRLEDWIY